MYHGLSSALTRIHCVLMHLFVVQPPLSRPIQRRDDARVYWKVSLGSQSSEILLLYKLQLPSPSQLKFRARHRMLGRKESLPL